MCFVNLKYYPVCGSFHPLGPPEFCTWFKHMQEQACYRDWDWLEMSRMCPNTKTLGIEAIQSQICPSCSIWYLRATKPSKGARRCRAKKRTGWVEEESLADESANRTASES